MFGSMLVLPVACGGDDDAPTRAAPVATAKPVAKAPAAAKSTGGPSYGGVLRYVGAPAFQTTDPVFGVGDPITLVHYLLFNQIVKLGTELDIQPELAESWVVGSDNKSVTFAVRKGITFQDGTMFTADSVKWNLDRCLDPAVACISKTKIEQIESVSVQDPYTFTIHLKNPYRPILAALAEIAGFMSSPTQVEKYDSYADHTGDYGKYPGGTGPFIMSEWVPETRLLLEKYDGYWEDGKPYLDAIDFIPLPEGTSGLAMLRTNETDIMEISPRELPLLKDNANVKTSKYDSGRTYNFAVNANAAPLGDKGVRQALIYAFDKEKFIDAVFAGEGRPAHTIIGQGWAWDQDLKPFNYDVDKAKSLLSDAGFANGIETSIMCRTTGIWPEVCEAFQAMMAPADIKVNIEAVSRGVYTPRRLDADFAIIPSYRTPLGDPHLLIGELFQAGGRGNFNRYDNPAVNKLLLQAGGVFDLDQAKGLYSDALRMIHEDVPMIPYMWSTEYAAMSTKVGNFERTPDLDLKLRDLWLDK
jgi:ABC-type transport system substrate-binding protein